MLKKNWKVYLFSILLTLAVGGLSNLFTSNSQETYEMMYRPPLAPPAWVFPVVWTILFILMGIAAAMVYVSDSPEKQHAIRLYIIQLLINAIWPLIFFNWSAYLVAFIWLLLLWYLVYLTTKKFAKINITAGRLMVPYLIWLTFAAYLNLAIVINAFKG